MCLTLVIIEEKRLGVYMNRGNVSFRLYCEDEYVDKSGLISLVNRAIETKSKLICVSRPRRFGKSTAAQMLCAYYDRPCDSQKLFDDLEIARNPQINGDYKKYLNSFNVVSLNSRDDVLTLLVHYGYFSYNYEKGTIRIPNEEIHTEFNE